MADTKKDNTVYFAARPDTEIVPYLRRKIEEYYDYLETFGHAERISKSMAYNSGGTLDGGHCTWKINRGGEDGEVLLNAENHYRAIGQSQVNLTTAQRPSIEAKAKNSDKQAISRAAVGKGLVDFYLSEADLEGLLKVACEFAVFGTEGHIFVDWDHKAGPTKGRMVPVLGEDGQPQIDPETQQPQLEAKELPIGDVRFRVFDTTDVVRDPYAPSNRSLTWKILRTWVNKFDLAARYPELEEEIVNLSAGSDKETRTLFQPHKDDSTLVPVWEFYHERTPALPNGRYVKFCKELWLEGGPLPFRKIPLARCTPSELLNTPFGYSAQLDLLGAQETVNGLDTTITTNQLGRGIGNMLVPRTANMSLEMFATSMNQIKYDGTEKPEALAMPPTPPEFFQYKKDKISAMETISGINSVVRGNPSENVGADASGSKLALLQAQAVQQNSGLEKTYVQLIRDVAMNIITIFRDFGGSESRVVKMIGKYNSYMVKEFLPSDLEDVEDISVDIGNPVTRQISGRMALADRLVELGLIKPENMSYYITLIQEGTLDPMIQGQQACQLRIEEENEKLLAGEQDWQHRALITDPHWDEIPKHLELLDNPDLRLPGAEVLQQKILEAVQEHMQLFRAMPPELVILRGGDRAFNIWNAMQQAPGVAQPQAQPQQNPGTKPAPAKASAQDVMAKDSQAQQPQMPQQPRNPATGLRPPEPRGVVNNV